MHLLMFDTSNGQHTHSTLHRFNRTHVLDISTRFASLSFFRLMLLLYRLDFGFSVGVDVVIYAHFSYSVASLNSHVNFITIGIP